MRRDLADRIRALKTLLTGTFECTAAIEDEHKGKPARDAPAARDDPVVTSISREWGRDAFVIVQTVAGGHLLACIDHLQALDRLLDEPLPVLADLTIVRGALETGARAWWLHDPHTTPLYRLARGWTEWLHARRESNRLKAEFDVAEQVNTARDRPAPEDRALRGAEADGLEHGSARGAVWVGQQRPSTTQLVGWMNPELGRASWRWMSGTTHGLIQHVLTRTDPVTDERSPTGLSAQERPRTLSEIYTVAAVAIQAHTAAFERRLAYFGWDDTHWREWRRHVTQTLLPAFPPRDEDE